MGIGGEATALIALQAGHADVEDSREHPLGEPVLLPQRHDLLGLHDARFVAIGAIELFEPLVDKGSPSDGASAFRANVMLDIGLDRHAADFLDMVPYLVRRVDFLPALLA